MRKLAGQVGAFLFFLAITNFAGFVLECLWLGGDALNGKVDGDRYYLLKVNHRETMYVETTRPLWRLNRIHGLSMLVTQATGILVGAPLMAYAAHQPKRARHGRG